MLDTQVFALGFERTRWLAARLSVVAGNVANADTPGYKPRDVPSFENALTLARTDLYRTVAGHMAVDRPEGRAFEVIARDGALGKHSGNAVSLETEMAALGETRSQQSMVTGLLSAFQRILLASTKG